MLYPNFVAFLRTGNKQIIAFYYLSIYELFKLNFMDANILRRHFNDLGN